MSRNPTRLPCSLLLLLFLNQLKAETLPELNWKVCENRANCWCADLYFCAVPATAENWKYWNTRVEGFQTSSATGTTYGSLWPFFTDDDPNGSNGWIYGYYREEDKGLAQPCRPGLSPVIRVRPGRTYYLTMHNTADRKSPDDYGPGEVPVNMTHQLFELGTANIWKDDTMEDMMPAHVTNLHVHGIHQSGCGSHDNVLVPIMPGDCLTYIYVIPQDMSGGTLWYHPHFHGKVVYQAFGGAFGMFIVEDEMPNLRKANGEKLNSQVVDFLTNRNTERLLVAFMGFNLYYGNGEPAGTPIQLTVGQWHRLRVSYVNPEGLVKWTAFIDEGALPYCEIREIAWDGVFASTVPYNVDVAQMDRRRVAVHGGGRIDYAVRCMQQGNFRLKYGTTDPAYGTLGTVAKFTVLDGSPTSASPYEPGTQSWQPLRIGHLADLRDGYYPAEVKKFSPVFPIYVSMQGLNGLLFDPNKALHTFEFGKETIHQILFTGVALHPTHMHQQYFQIVQPGGCGPAMKEGEFYDTVTTLDPDATDLAPYDKAECLVRFRMVDFACADIIHCHVLDHEDIGIMGWFEVPIGPGAFEKTGLFVPASGTIDCCIPRRKGNGEVVCRNIPECGRGAGWDTCNNPCTVPVQSCPSGQSCSADYRCVAEARAALCSGNGEAPTTNTPPVYPWIVAGVAIGVAILVIAGAVFYVRHRLSGYTTVMMEDICLQPYEQQRPCSSPFIGHSSPLAVISESPCAEALPSPAIYD